MGRAKPSTRISDDRRREVDLAHTVDVALTRLDVVEAIPIGTDAAGDDAAIEALIGGLDAPVDVNGNGNGSGTGERAAALAPVPRPIPPIRLNLVTLDGIEVTQAVQDIGHSVPLVAGKATIVRVYLKFPTPVEVRGELQAARSANGPWTPVPSIGPAQLDPARAGGTLAQLRSRRADLRFSLNFRLPAVLTGPGPVFLRMAAVRRTTGTPLPSVAGIHVRSVTFARPATLRVRLVRMIYAMAGRTFQPSATDASLFGSWLSRAYPTDRLLLSTGTATANPAAPFDAAQINAQLIALRAVDVGTGTDPRTHYYGMVSDGGFFMRGLASGIPQSPAPGTVASGPTGSSTFGWDNDGSYGDWYGGHELGHTFGRFHVEFCGAIGGAPYPFPNGQLSGPDEAFVGIDVGDPALGLPLKLMGSVAAHDVMTYCNNQWLSSFTYGGIYQRLVAENALPGSGGAEGMAMVQDADSAMVPAAGRNPRPAGFRIIGSVNLTVAAGSISAVLPAAPGADDNGDAVPAGPDGHQLSIRLLDADGELIDERPAAFRPSSCEDPDQDVTGVIDSVVPVLSGASAVEVLLDGAVLDRRPIGGPVSRTADLRPGAADAGPTPDGGRQLSWEVPDAPAGQRYAVQLSDDGGASWRAVAVDLAQPEVRLAADELAGPAGEPLLVRLLAVTGLSSAVVSTDPVTPG
jgi:hypothetical protein